MSVEKLLGGWTLVSWEISYSENDRVTHPFGESPKGTIIYTKDGWMSATVSRSKRDLFPQGRSIKSLPKEIRADAYNSYFSYTGRYTVEGNDVIHQVEQSLNPNFVGTTQVRHMAFRDNRLILSGEDIVNTGKRTHLITWQRAAEI